MNPNEEAVKGQRLVRLEAAGIAVTVREMRWKAALGFLDLMGKSIGGLLVVGEGGKVAFDASNLPKLVSESTVLTDYVLKNCVSGEVNVDELGTGDALTLLSAAIDLTLNEDTLGKLKLIGGKVTAAFQPATM